MPEDVEESESQDSDEKAAEDGDVYDGEWEGDFRAGKGCISYSNGDMFDGEWLGGVRSGVGIYHYNNGDMFEGQWLDDTKNGKLVL